MYPKREIFTTTFCSTENGWLVIHPPPVPKTDPPPATKVAKLPFSRPAPEVRGTDI
jgi:hypothetical protein